MRRLTWATRTSPPRRPRCVPVLCTASSSLVPDVSAAAAGRLSARICMKKKGVLGDEDKPTEEPLVRLHVNCSPGRNNVLQNCCRTIITMRCMKQCKRRPEWRVPDAAVRAVQRGGGWLGMKVVQRSKPECMSTI